MEGCLLPSAALRDASSAAWDNGSTHHAEPLRRFCDRNGGRLTVVELPLYAPTEAPSAALIVAGVGGSTRRFRIEDPQLLLADDAEDEDRLSGWSTDEDADTLVALAGGTFGLTVKHRATPGTPPLAVLGEVGVIDRFRSGSGGLRLTLAWPAGLRGTAASGARSGLVRHGVAYAGPGGGCVCKRHDCGGVVPVFWCEEHSDVVGPVLEWPPKAGSALRRYPHHTAQDQPNSEA
ncbi:hypothetical protein [Streptomyces sp. BF23-19]|uniref:hypothetical protein n=1 Tax=unclassified Streptomyces TaxID=2593676 RepID=UPI0034E3B2E6